MSESGDSEVSDRLKDILSNLSLSGVSDETAAELVHTASDAEDRRVSLVTTIKSIDKLVQELHDELVAFECSMLPLMSPEASPVSDVADVVKGDGDGEDDHGRGLSPALRSLGRLSAKLSAVKQSVVDLRESIEV